jgi:hypothetical protein
MSTSPSTPNTRLHKPTSGERVPPDTRDYLRARAKRHAYDLVMRELKKSGITRAELARRLGRGADRVSKMLGGPSNWTIITLSDLLFAINAGVPKYEIDYPLDKKPRNFGPRQQYEWKKEGANTSGGNLTLPKPFEFSDIRPVE